jgi:protein phosphatase
MKQTPGASSAAAEKAGNDAESDARHEPENAPRAGGSCFCACGLSDIGIVRKENQDSLLIHEPEDPRLLSEKGTLLVVADGMGGLEGGSVASRLAVEAMERFYYSDPGDVPTALENAAKQANSEVYERASALESGRQMGSTLTAASLLGDHAWIAQVGDSRAYLYRDGKIQQLTRDHSLVQELVERGNLDKTSGGWWLNRNIVTRGLGLEPEVKVDLYEVKDLRAGDTLLLSSDGFHELVMEEEMVDALKRFVGDLEGACREYIRLARERGGPDNITVALASVKRAEARPFLEEDGALASQGNKLAPGWFLPVALFLCFAGGVISTLLLQGPLPMSEKQVRELRAEIDGTLKVLESKDAELRGHLERLRVMLPAGKEPPAEKQ